MLHTRPWLWGHRAQTSSSPILEALSAGRCWSGLSASAGRDTAEATPAGGQPQEGQQLTSQTHRQLSVSLLATSLPLPSTLLPLSCPRSKFQSHHQRVVGPQ